ncbi:hypothetical protein Tco_0440540 [Tanacetum coccineum]
MGIDFSKTLEEHDPLNKMNDLARKKRNHADEIHDYFRPTKRILLPLNTLEISQIKCYTLHKKSSSDFIKDMDLMIMPKPSVPSYSLKLTKRT